MPKLKYTTKEIKEKIFELTGNEYEMMGEYVGALTKFKIKHNTCGCVYEVNWTNFQSGRRCPKCAGKHKYTDSEISKLVSEMTNGEYTKLSEYKDSKTKFKIRHEKCNFEYEVNWSNFQQGQRCPKCSRRPTYTDEEISRLVSTITNGEYTKLSEYKGSRTKFKIRHNTCGNEYEVSWVGFRKGDRCPKCSKRHIYSDQEITDLITEITNKEYTKIGTYINSKNKFKIRHNLCGHEYEVSWNHFQQGKRCPKCKQPRGEKFIESYLTNHNISFSTQVRFDDCRYKRPLPFDFAILNKEKKIIALIEFDGLQHYRPINYFGGEEAFKERQRKDLIKTNYCKENNIPLLRIKYDENTEEKLFNFLGAILRPMAAKP